MDLVTESRSEMQHMVKVLDKVCERWGIWHYYNSLPVSEQQETEHPSIILQYQALEKVESFPYLGSETGQSTMVEKEVAMRVKKGSTVYQILRCKIFRSQILSKSTKVLVFRTMVMPILLYGTETWPVMQKDIRKLTFFQMRCLQIILGLTLYMGQMP